jgi:hypothetical protein
MPQPRGFDGVLDLIDGALQLQRARPSVRPVVLSQAARADKKDHGRLAVIGEHAAV